MHNIRPGIEAEIIGLNVQIVSEGIMASPRLRVAVVGASAKPDRYSNRAVRLLVEHGHEVVPIHPIAASIEGLPAVPGLEKISGHVHTITMYVSAKRSSALESPIARLKPDRVIFNPGAENPALRAALEAQGIKTVEACTLVMLKTGQF